jgi:hypothetical protein
MKDRLSAGGHILNTMKKNTLCVHPEYYATLCVHPENYAIRLCVQWHRSETTHMAQLWLKQVI